MKISNWSISQENIKLENFPQNVEDLGYPSSHEIVFVLVEITSLNRFFKSENSHPKNSL
jgi:hypothetical protein